MLTRDEAHYINVSIRAVEHVHRGRGTVLLMITDVHTLRQCTVRVTPTQYIEVQDQRCDVVHQETFPSIAAFAEHYHLL